MLKYALIYASNVTAAYCGVFLFADQWERAGVVVEGEAGAGPEGFGVRASGCHSQAVCQTYVPSELLLPRLQK